jgi:hypothetical protein
MVSLHEDGFAGLDAAPLAVGVDQTQLGSELAFIGQQVFDGERQFGPGGERPGEDNDGQAIEGHAWGHAAP